MARTHVRRFISRTSNGRRWRHSSRHSRYNASGRFRLKALSCLPGSNSLRTFLVRTHATFMYFMNSSRLSRVCISRSEEVETEQGTGVVG